MAYRDQRCRKNGLQLALLIGVALGVLCLLIGDQVECRSKEDEGGKSDDAESEDDGAHLEPAKDGGGDADKEKAASKETVVEKKVKDDSVEENKSAGDNDGDVKKKRKHEKEKKVIKETKTVIATTKTPELDSTSSRNGSSTASPGKHEKGSKTHGKKDHKKEDQRVSGGSSEYGIPAYLATLWQAKPAGNLPDGRYVGNAILVGDGKILIHSESKSKIDRMGGGEKKSIPEDVIFNNPSTLDIEGISKRSKFREITAVRTGIGNSVFGLYNIKNERSTSIPPLPEIPKSYPTLEHDYNDYGKDCYVYGWTRNLGTGPEKSHGPRSEQRYRQFVRFPVEHDPGSCRNGLCELSTDHGSICDGLGDYGLPVLCGNKKVLTYILKGMEANVDGMGCRRGNIPAYHVGSMIEELKELVPGLIHTGQRRAKSA